MSELIIGGTPILRGQRYSIDLPIAQLYTHAPLTMPVQVVAGKKSGPVMFVIAALHGDEINGVEIIRRLLKSPSIKSLRGTLIAVPIVNVPGFIQRSRYLPDRRDLNRSFPGHPTGSLAGRMAHGLIREILAKADYGIDLHTGAVHRANLPQIRANLDSPIIAELAHAFGAPLILDSKPVAGTLREYTSANNIPVLLYEAGEALRFDEASIRVGLRGIINVLRKLEMLPKSSRPTRARQPVTASSSQWVRADASGVLRTVVALGGQVKKGQLLAYLSDTLGESESTLNAPFDGLIIGKLNLPLVFAGEAVFHIARSRMAGEAAAEWEELQAADDFPEPAIV
ncbi:MAG: succinylglutamate desuccinylase/aspartoacylase family protein [Oceanococcus sp.]